MMISWPSSSPEKQSVRLVDSATFLTSLTKQNTSTRPTWTSESDDSQPLPPLSPSTYSASTIPFAHLSTRIRRRRRAASQVDRPFRCQEPRCSRAYGTTSALKKHVKSKHPKLFARLYGEPGNFIQNNSNALTLATPLESLQKLAPIATILPSQQQQQQQVPQLHCQPLLAREQFTTAGPLPRFLQSSLVDTTSRLPPIETSLALMTGRFPPNPVTTTTSPIKYPFRRFETQDGQLLFLFCEHAASIDYDPLRQKIECFEWDFRALDSTLMIKVRVPFWLVHKMLVEYDAVLVKLQVELKARIPIKFLIANSDDSVFDNCAVVPKQLLPHRICESKKHVLYFNRMVFSEFQVSNIVIYKELRVLSLVARSERGLKRPVWKQTDTKISTV